MRKLVLLGVILHFVIGVGHLACLFCLEAVFGIYGINGIMDEIAVHGAALPYLITIGIAAAFFLAGCSRHFHLRFRCPLKNIVIL